MNELAQPTPSDKEAARTGTVLRPGRLAMWLFISTEVMFFAALFATYLILRLDTIDRGWPPPYLLHVSIGIGILNTLILVLSAVTAWHAVKSAQADKPHTARIFLLMTVTLGIAFLGVKAYEYQSKHRLGLLPIPGKKQMFDRANYEYLAAVNACMNDRIRALEKKNVEVGRLDQADQESLDTLYELKTYFTAWTSRIVGRLPNNHDRQLSMRLMAYQIYPHPDTAHGIDEIRKSENEHLLLTKQQLETRLSRVVDRQEFIDKQLEDLRKTVEGMELINPGEIDGENDLQAKKNWFEVKQKQALELEADLRDTQTNLEQIDGRLNCLVKLDGMLEEGLNSEIPIRLPVVVTSGSQWMNAYMLLTLAHALHVLAGVIVFLFFLTRRLDLAAAPGLHLAGMYWQFVDIVWLTIFWLIYF